MKAPTRTSCYRGLIGPMCLCRTSSGDLHDCESTASFSLHTIYCALGAHSGTLTLYDRADEDGSQHATMYSEVITSLYRPAVTMHEVPVRTLDEIADMLTLSRIDLLKIDTEGHELEVLHGARKLLAAGLIRVLHIELTS